jgi:5-deoxy-glucuronate isomerase
MLYTADNLLVHPIVDSGDPDLVQRIAPGTAGWDYIHFEVRRLKQGRAWSFAVEDFELAFVDLSGRFNVESNRGRWDGIGGRSDVFKGGAHALYLPRRSELTVRAEESGEFAVAWVPTNEDHEPFLVRPDQVKRSIRGGDNVSRQINDLLPPGSPVHRLVLVEVYTPGGNWSSYPPHKHDRHVVGADGELVEADLEEVYFYKLQPETGFAYQWVYTDERSPVHQAGQPIDALVRPGHNSAVLIPEGYHPVVSMPGYTTYYLNVLAGSAQSLANQDDPRFTWVKHQYRGTDPRLPLY